MYFYFYCTTTFIIIIIIQIKINFFASSKNKTFLEQNISDPEDCFISEYDSFVNGGTNDNDMHSSWHIRTGSKVFYKDSSSFDKFSHGAGAEKKFACVICSKQFARLWNLERHIKNVHSDRFPVCI